MGWDVDCERRGESGEDGVSLLSSLRILISNKVFAKLESGREQTNYGKNGVIGGCKAQGWWLLRSSRMSRIWHVDAATMFLLISVRSLRTNWSSIFIHSRGWDYTEYWGCVNASYPMTRRMSWPEHDALRDKHENTIFEFSFHIVPFIEVSLTPLLQWEGALRWWHRYFRHQISLQIAHSPIYRHQQ